MALFQSIGFEPSELSRLFEVLDGNSEGFVDLYEFINGMMKLQREGWRTSFRSQCRTLCFRALDALQQRLGAMEDTFQRAFEQESLRRAGVSVPASPANAAARHHGRGRHAAENLDHAELPEGFEERFRRLVDSKIHEIKERNLGPLAAKLGHLEAAVKRLVGTTPTQMVNGSGAAQVPANQVSSPAA